MNILHVINSVDPASGGPVEGVRSLSGVITRLGHRVEVASTDPPDAPYVKTFPLALYPLGPGHLAYSFTPRLLPWLRQHAREYDVVVVNGIWRYHSFAVWRALRESPTPYVVYTHGMLDPWFKHRYPLKHLKKWLYWPWADYRVLRDASAVLFTCQEERTLARKSFWLYSANEVVVHYGTSEPTGQSEGQQEAFYSAFPALTGKNLCLYLGRIHPKKGCDLVLEAFNTVLRPHPDWHLVIAGPEERGLRAQLESRARQLQMSDRVTWTGLIRDGVKWGAIRSSEFLLLPSHQENFGIVVAEALACGLPALISNKVNIWREIEQEHAGLVAADDEAGTCGLLRRWLSMPSSAHMLVRQNARQCFIKHFEIHEAADSLLRVLWPLANTQPPQPQRNEGGPLT